MADKKTILIIGAGEELTGGTHVTKFTKKAAKVTNYKGGDLPALLAANGSALCCELDQIAENIGKDHGFVCVRQGEDMEACMEKVMGAADRRTLIIWVGDKTAYFGGFGTKKGGVTDREVVAADLLPTINFIADVPLTEDATGAVIYQVLKDVNLKAREIGRLKDAIARMEAAMERHEETDPWKKHDCS